MVGSELNAPELVTLQHKYPCRLHTPREPLELYFVWEDHHVLKLYKQVVKRCGCWYIGLSAGHPPEYAAEIATTSSLN